MPKPLKTGLASSAIVISALLLTSATPHMNLTDVERASYSSHMGEVEKQSVTPSFNDSVRQVDPSSPAIPPSVVATKIDANYKVTVASILAHKKPSAPKPPRPKEVTFEAVPEKKPEPKPQKDEKVPQKKAGETPLTITPKKQSRNSASTSSESDNANSSTEGMSAKAFAAQEIERRGWSKADMQCLVKLWTKESHWNHKAENPSSGAYGIPQSLPGSKMASAGSDWRTNPQTQVKWGLGYISDRYGTPCAAWGHSQKVNWY